MVRTLSNQENTADKKEIKKKPIFDYLLIAILLTVAIAVFLVLNINREPGAFVRVSVGETTVQYSLKENGEYSLNGGTNILVIEDGTAYMKSADCPRKTCVLTGKISKTGQRITCLENKVYVVVVGAGEEIFESQ